MNNVDSFPIVSVIIPTLNRCAELAKTLDALSSQTLPPSRFEVIVVDDGSTDDTPRIAAVPYPFRLHYVRQQNQGGVAARNHGAMTGRGEMLVFIDDDITFDPSYLEAILGTHQRGRKFISMGVFQPYRTSQDSAFAVLYPRIIPVQTTDQGDQLVSFTQCTSNNLAIERQDFLDLGMWHDVLGGGPGIWGDVEFGYRAWKKGFKFLRVANAKLYHRDHTIENLQSACERHYYISHTVHLLFQRNPETRQYLPTFWDKHPISFSSDSLHLIVRKIFRIAASSLPAVWAMERLAHLLENRAPASLLLVLLYRWIISAYIYKGYRHGFRELAEAGI